MNTLSSRDEYDTALAEFSKLLDLDPEPNTPEGIRFVELADALQEYENSFYPFIPPTPEEMEAFRREMMRL